MNKNQGGRRTKQLISLALYQLLISKEYEDISVKDICDKARISRMSFYRYFTCKDDIFINYCDERFEEFYNMEFKNKELKLEPFICALFSFIKKYTRQIKILIKANKQQILSSQFNNYATYMINKTRANNNDKGKTNFIIAAFVSGGIFNVTMTWIANGLKETPEEMTQILMSIIGLNGVV